MKYCTLPNGERRRVRSEFVLVFTVQFICACLNKSFGLMGVRFNSYSAQSNITSRKADYGNSTSALDKRSACIKCDRNTGQDQDYRGYICKRLKDSHLETALLKLQNA